MLARPACRPRDRFHSGLTHSLRPLAPLLAAMVVTCLAGPARASDPFYANMPFVPVFMGGGESAVADLNGDGKLDLVQADKNNNRVAVRRGIGGGRFEAALGIMSAGNFPIALALGDLDGDLIPDAVVANYFDSQISFLHGSGSGVLGPPVPMATGTRPIHVVIADVDADGRNDIITANEQANTLTLYRGIMGGFAPRVDIPTGVTPYAIVVGRLDADLIPDLAVACFGGNVLSLHRGLGGGAFAAPTTLPTETNPIALAGGDLDGDGDLDLVCANFTACCSRMVSIFRGNGDGTFAAHTNHGLGNYPHGVAVADLDADGAPEILISNGDRNALSVLQGAGGWGFPGQVDIPAGYTPSTIAVADFDGDGKLDAAVGGDRGYVAMMHGLHNGSFGPFVPVGPTGPGSVAIGDLNGDAKLDLVAGSSVRLGNGDGTFGPGAFVPSLGAPRLVDLNGDNRLDLVGLGGSAVASMLGNGDGTFGALLSQSTGFGANDLALGDLNGDAKLDAVVTCFGSITLPPGEISILLGNGDGTFAPHTSIGGGIVGWGGLALADLDLDGKLDLVALRGGSPISEFHGNGDGTFAAPVLLSTALLTPEVITLARFDGDLKPDMILGGNGGAMIQIRLGIGDGTFTSATPIQTPGGVSALRVGDLDGDGFPDLAISGGAHIVTVARGDGIGGILEQHLYGTGSFPGGLAIGDLNGDVRPDIVVACPNSNFVHPLFNVHPGYPTPVQVSLASAEALPDRVRLAWFAEGAEFSSARVERRSESESWRALSDVSRDGSGLVRYEDRAVAAGSRYAYRLAWDEQGMPRATSETWVSIPNATGFALHGARPQPALDRLRVAFTLPSNERARLELFDLSGRRIGAREVGALGAGEHVVDLMETARLAPGVYLLRLTQGARSEVARATVLE